MKRNRNHMKKTLLLTLALGLAGATSLVAQTVDVYITGSTAFRANVYNACTKLFSSAPNIYYADGNHGGVNSGFNNGTASWVMTGAPAAGITNLSSVATLNVHGFFTGSVQGLQTAEQATKLVFAQPHGTAGGNADTYTTNAPTIGFSDASGAATPFSAPSGFLEENVCVQPFVWVKSAATAGSVTTISNITWEQIEYGIPAGRIPFAAWSYQNADTNKFVYLIQRTKDSGTRRCETQGEYFQYNDPCAVYIYDYTNNFFYGGPNNLVGTPLLTNTFFGGFPAGVIGTEGPGLGNANMGWGFGYIGGGDIKNSLNNNNAANQSIAYLSIADAKGVNVNSGGNWSGVMSYNGIWPTAAGVGIHNNSGTNDYSPITLGYYPLYGFEVLVHYEATGSQTPSTVIPGQNLTFGQLGDQLSPGSFMGVFNAQSFNNGGVVLQGSIEADIISSQPGGATGIPLAAMSNSRPNVGGTIYPKFQ
jgi:hypothetical protein